MERKKKDHQLQAEANDGSRLNRRQFLKIGSAGAVFGAVELVNSPAKLAADAAMCKSWPAHNDNQKTHGIEAIEKPG